MPPFMDNWTARFPYVINIAGLGDCGPGKPYGGIFEPAGVRKFFLDLEGAIGCLARAPLIAAAVSRYSHPVREHSFSN